MAEYTKGEWKVRSGFRVTANEGLMYIADCYPYNEKLTRPKLIEAEANARLIAAAPDLYEACKKALRDLEQVIPYAGKWALVDELKQAIAKGEVK